MGAGGGGFMVFLVRPELQAKVRERLKHLVHVRVRFDREGSRIIVYEPDRSGA
jgi:D-glycero-alpha-D-manno-heptose-7-phosphate kinase